MPTPHFHKEIQQPTKRMETSTTITVVLTVALLVLTCRVVEGQSDCVSKLTPCALYLNSTNPPASCCDAIKEVVSTQLDCLCKLYNTPGLLASIGINVTQALLLPKHCNLPSDTSACNALAPGSSSVPAAPSGKDGNGNGVGRTAWTGMPALLLVTAISFLC